MFYVMFYTWEIVATVIDVGRLVKAPPSFNEFVLVGTPEKMHSNMRKRHIYPPVVNPQRPMGEVELRSKEAGTLPQMHLRLASRTPRLPYHSQELGHCSCFRAFPISRRLEDSRSCPTIDAHHVSLILFPQPAPLEHQAMKASVIATWAACCWLTIVRSGHSPPHDHFSSGGTFSHLRLREIDEPRNVTIRHQEISLCETTPGVRSYSGYVDAEDGSHHFFWLFQARKDPETAPITLWLNGGPGSDSMVGLFQGAVLSLYSQSVGFGI